MRTPSRRPGLSLVVTAAFLSLGCTSRPSGRSPTDAQSVVQVDPRAAVCPSPDAAPAAVTFQQVQQIFNENCIICHTVGNTLNLTIGVAWPSLVNRPAPDPNSCGCTLVVPGDAAGSYLYQKLASATPCYGAQMPRGEFTSNPLPACVVAMVAQWIAEGAPSSPQDGSVDGPPPGN